MKRSHIGIGTGAVCLVIAAIAVTKVGLPVFAQQQPEAATVEKSSTCEMRVTILNNRSRLLTSYQKTESQKYQNERDKWAKRIAYAGRWIPQEAETVRGKLYYQDALYRNLDNEIAKQIEQYKVLEAQPLDCTPAKRAELTAKLKEVNGVQDKKVVGGQALIEKLKRQQTNYNNGEFKQATKDMMKHLHEQKEKAPYNKNKDIEVKAYSKH